MTFKDVTTSNTIGICMSNVTTSFSNTNTIDLSHHILSVTGGTINITDFGIPIHIGSNVISNAYITGVTSGGPTKVYGRTIMNITPEKF
jgi:hypothetical protein